MCFCVIFAFIWFVCLLLFHLCLHFIKIKTKHKFQSEKKKNTFIPFHSLLHFCIYNFHFLHCFSVHCFIVHCSLCSATLLLHNKQLSTQLQFNFFNLHLHSFIISLPLTFTFHPPPFNFPNLKSSPPHQH